jgi:hypothetical protein
MVIGYIDLHLALRVGDGDELAVVGAAHGTEPGRKKEEERREEEGGGVERTYQFTWLHTIALFGLPVWLTASL